jgi:hypothetical protein
LLIDDFRYFRLWLFFNRQSLIENPTETAPETHAQGAFSLLIEAIFNRQSKTGDPTAPET